MSKLLQLYRDNANREKRPVNIARNADGATEASLYIYDVIDAYWGVSAADVINALNSVGDAEVLHVYINSPGGDVFEGRAIMAALARFKGKKIAHIDSLCASAATSIALACNEVEMTSGSFFMIHNASGFAWGDKNVLRETADMLEKIEGAIVEDYTTKTGQSAEQVVAWMNDETWFDATEALDNGFIDRVTDSPAKAALSNAAWNLASYAKAPPALTAKAPVKPAAEVVVVPPASGGDEALTAAEVTFLTDMAALHESAIARAKAVLPLAQCDDVEDLAEDIISRQAGTLELMKTWLDLRAAPEPEVAPDPAPANCMTRSNKNRLTLLLAS